MMITNNKVLDYNACASAIEGKTSILKIGCFDIFHVGHLHMFKRCKKIADVLIVMVGSDNVINNLYQDKTKKNTVFEESHRIDVISSIHYVDYVVKLNETTHEKALSIIKPTYYHVPNDDRWLDKKKDMCNSLGINLVIDENTELINHGVKFEPHSSIFKNGYRD